VKLVASPDLGVVVVVVVVVRSRNDKIVDLLDYSPSSRGIGRRAKEEGRRNWA